MTTRHEAAKANLRKLINVLAARRVAVLSPLERAIIQKPAKAKSVKA